MKRYHETIVGTAIAISGMLAILIAVLAAIDIWCYSGRISFAAWGGSTEMAIPTAVCFLLIGSALVLTATLVRSVARNR